MQNMIRSFNAIRVRIWHDTESAISLFYQT